MSGLGMSIAKKNYDIGMQQGIQQGRRQGRLEGSLKTLINLVKNNRLSIADAAGEANMSVNEFVVKMNEAFASA